MSTSMFLSGLSAVAVAGLFLSGVVMAEDPQAGPVLSVKDDRFLLDGKETGLWGIRVASGTHTQQQCDHLIAQLDAYKAHGVNALTVFYMGCRGANYDPFAPDGKGLDPGHQERMERIIRACAERNMIVVVGIFYQAAPIRLQDADAVRSAMRLVTEKLKPYRNVIINVCNEQNSGGWQKFAKVFDFRDTEKIVELCRLVHEVDPRRIVGGGGYDQDKNIVLGKARDVDVLLFDTAGFEPHLGKLYQRFIEAGVKGKPIVNVETFGGVTAKYPRGIFSDELKKHYFCEVDDAAATPGLSVFFHNNPWCQSQDQPMRYDLGGQGTEGAPGIRWYFEYVRKKLGIEKAAPAATATDSPAGAPATPIHGSPPPTEK